MVLLKQNLSHSINCILYKNITPNLYTHTQDSNSKDDTLFFLLFLKQLNHGLVNVLQNRVSTVLQNNMKIHEFIVI